MRDDFVTVCRRCQVAAGGLLIYQLQNWLETSNTNRHSAIKDLYYKQESRHRNMSNASRHIGLPQKLTFNKHIK